MSLDLGRITLFKGLPAEDLRALGERVVPRSLPADAVVFREGDPGDSLYLILSGKVKVCLHDANGKEFVVASRGAGHYVGEMMLDGSPRSATVTTTEPSEFGVLSRADLKDVLAKHPEVALHLYIESLKATRGKDLPSVKRWAAAKRWALVTLLVFAIGQYYFLDVLLEMVSLGGGITSTERR